MQFRDLLIEHAGQSMDRQMGFRDLLGEDRAWHTNHVEGWIDFGDAHRYDIHILGTESYISNTWLWAWGNQSVVDYLKPEMLGFANQAKRLGEMFKIDQLQQAQFDLDIADGHALALICRGVVGADCYYRAPQSDESGAAYLLITGTSLPNQLSPLLRISMVISEVITYTARWELPHRHMITSYLNQQRFIVDNQGSQLIARRGEHESIQIEFDAQGRVADISSTL